MKFILLSILVSGLFTSTAAGQVQDSDLEIYPRQASINHNEAVKSFSSEYIFSFLNTSSSFDLQQSANRSGNLAIVNVEGIENTAVLTQIGWGITGVIDISGQLNKANLDQRGTDLLSVLNIQGNANQFNLTQLGNSLQNYFQVFGSELNFDAMQTDKGIRLTQSGVGSIPFSILQRGSLSPIIINNN